MVFKIYKKSLILIIVIFFILILFLFSLEKKKIITNYYFSKSNSACFKNNINSEEGKSKYYEIIIAGHSYGTPGALAKGTYIKFLNYLNQNLINKQDFFILAGDIVRKANRQNFKLIKTEIMKFSKKIIIAPGNHDVGEGSNNKQRKQFIQEFKKTLISQIDSYSATTQKTKLFVEYRQAVVNFINGSRKIKLQISPETPVSIAELTPYFLNPDINSIISKLNLHVSN